MTDDTPTRRTFASGLALSPVLFFAACEQSELLASELFQGDGKAEGLRTSSRLVIRNASFENFTYAAIRVNQPTDGLIIENCQGNNLYRFLENSASGGAASASLTNFAVRQTSALGLQRGMTRIRYDSHGGLIEDVTANASDNPADFCVGFALDDTAHDIIYRRAEAHGFAVRNMPSDKYWNGDGFTDERGNRNIQYLACVATGSSDGGFDLKSTDVLLAGCTARGNKRNYRLWGSGRLDDCKSEEPQNRGGTGRPAHFSFFGDTAKYVIDRPTVRARPDNPAPVFLFNNDQPAVIEIHNADIDAIGAPLIVSEKVKPVINFIPPLAQQKIRTLG